MILLFFFLLSLVSFISAIPQPLIFNRVDVANDIHKHVYIKTYSQTKESVLMYTMILFRSPLRQIIGSDANHSHDRYHNALLVGSHTYRQYYKITKDSHFIYNNEIPLIARGLHFMVPFSIVESRDAWQKIAKTSYTKSSSGATLDNIDVYDVLQMDATSTPAMNYHAILSLDKHSSIWDLYNIMTLTPYYMTLRYEARGSVNHNIDEYSGVTKLKCHFKGVLDRCFIKSSQLKLGDGTIFHNSSYRFIIDLHSATSYLPTAIYFHLNSLPSSKKTLTLDDRFHLNNEFTYVHNPYDNDIIIGVDLVHIFPKIELSIENREINLWYFDANYIHNDTHEGVSIAFTFLLLIALYCYFEFLSNEPGFLFTLMARFGPTRWFFFAVRQVFLEITSLVLATLFMIITLFFTEFNSTYSCQRTILFTILSFYHIVLLSFVLIVTPKVTEQAIDYYLRHNKRNFTLDRDFERVKDAYLDGDRVKLSKEYTSVVIIRNTSLITLILLAILMKVNFSTTESYLYLVLLFFCSTIFHYFFAHYVTLGWLYWFTGKTSRAFLLFLCGETLCLSLYTIWSIFCVYLDYFHAVNSIYTEPFIVSVTLVLVSFAFLFACRSYYSRMEDVIQKDFATS